MKPCPKCKKGQILISHVLLSAPEGTYSLAGEQTKVVASMKAKAECSSCDFSVYGYLENPEIDSNGTFIRGHFVVEGTNGTDK